MSKRFIPLSRGDRSRLELMIRTFPSEINFPANFQFAYLGLDEERIKQLARSSAKVLDIGCGSKGDLVYGLRRLGVEAYGIDPVAPKESYFFQQAIEAESPDSGCIPVCDGTYDLVVSHSCEGVGQPEFNIGPLRQDLAPAYVKALKLEESSKSRRIISEALRVLKSGGSFPLWPWINLEEGFLESRGYVKGRVEISGGAGKIVREYMDLLGVPAEFLPEFLKVSGFRSEITPIS